MNIRQKLPGGSSPGVKYWALVEVVFTKKSIIKITNYSADIKCRY